MAEKTNTKTEAGRRDAQDADPVRAEAPTAEQRAADLTADQHALVAEPAASVGTLEPDTVASAKVVAPVEAEMSAADHMAQKFGNDPANPKLAPGLSMEEGRTVRLHRVTPDKAEPAVIDVHPEMVGDYLRAGWNQ